MWSPRRPPAPGPARTANFAAYLGPAPGAFVIAGGNGWLAYVADSAETRRLPVWCLDQLCHQWRRRRSPSSASTPPPTSPAGLPWLQPPALFTHAGASHRTILNKATAADTASLVFEDNTSGRAELGLTGDDAFHVKVSPNGSSWVEALNIAQASGLVTLPVGQLAFPATQNPAANVNTLDDYEEGTWTPALTFGGASTGITYGASTLGRYTKVGNLVTLTGMLTLTSKGSSTGAAQITGLPFTSLNDSMSSPVAPSVTPVGSAASPARCSVWCRRTRAKSASTNPRTAPASG